MSLQPLFMLMSTFLLSTPAIAPSAPVFAQGSVQVPRHNATEDHSPISQVLFKPSGGGKPPTTRGAGSRSDRRCPQDITTQSISLTALVPPNQSGLTWVEHPTVWVYLPKTSARQIVLSVKAEGAQQHSQRFLSITGEPAILGIPFDHNAPPLEVGKSYQWAVVLVCGDRPSPNDPFVTAWVQRVIPSKPFSEQPSALDRVVQYGAQGVWYDALTTLAEMRRSRPTDPTLAKLWTDFLTQPSVGLGAIAKEPLR